MDDDVRRYTARLTWELRKRGVPGDRIGDAVAQVESHTAESAESPRVAFGHPRSYAASLARTAARGHRWAGYVLHGLAGFVFAALLVIGLVGTVREDPPPWGVEPRLVALFAAVALVVYAVALLARQRHRIRDPREER